MNQSSPPKTIEQIIQNIYQLLSLDLKDTAKIQQFISILDDAVAIKKELQIASINKQLSQGQLLKQALNDSQTQKKEFADNQTGMRKDIQTFKDTKLRVLNHIPQFLKSIYEMKLLESLMSINYRKIKVNQELKERNKQIKQDYEQQDKQLSQYYSQHKNQEEIFINMKKQLEQSIKSKKIQKLNLAKEIDRYSFQQSRLREEYKQLLEKQNKEKIDQIKPMKHTQPYIKSKMIAVKQGQKNKIINIPTNIEIKAKILRRDYKFEKIIAVMLTISTVLLVLYYLQTHA